MHWKCSKTYVFTKKKVICEIIYNDLNHCMYSIGEMLENNLVYELFWKKTKINKVLYFFLLLLLNYLPLLSQCTNYSISFTPFLNLWKLRFREFFFRYLEHFLSQPFSPVPWRLKIADRLHLKILEISVLKQNFSYTHFRNFFTNSLNESSKAYILVIFMEDITSLVTATLSSVLFTVLTLTRKHLAIKFCRHKDVDWNCFTEKLSRNISQLLEGNTSGGVSFSTKLNEKYFVKKGFQCRCFPSTFDNFLRICNTDEQWLLCFRINLAKF